MPYVQDQLVGVASAVTDLFFTAAYGGAVIAGVVVVLMALLVMVRAVADRVLAEPFMGKGEVVSKEVVPGQTVYARAFGPTPLSYSTIIPQQFRLLVRTKHGNAAFRVSADVFDAVAEGDGVIVSLGLGRYSGRVYPRRLHHLEA